MKLFFDESGQSGCILRREDLLNFKTQPTFAVGALAISSASEEEVLRAKYKRFKEKYHITDEIKGNELLTRERNRELNYFKKHILNDKQFFVILYDKKFYLATLLLYGLIGRAYQEQMIVHFYQQATFLALQDDAFFVKYLQYIESPSPETFKMYLDYLITYEYKPFDVEENAVISMARKIQENHAEDKFYDDFLSFGWYDNPKFTNVINLNALSELIYVIKAELKFDNATTEYIHDHIIEFESTFKTELQDYGIDIQFADSKTEELLQITDNAVSILRHAYDRMIRYCRAEQQYEEASTWDMKLMASLMDIISVPHINFTVFLIFHRPAVRPHLRNCKGVHPPAVPDGCHALVCIRI